MPGPPYSTVTLAIPEPVTEEKIANILKELKENDVHLATAVTQLSNSRRPSVLDIDDIQ